MVGAKGFEPSTPCTPCRCATRLRYAPTEPEIIPALVGNCPHAVHRTQGRTGLAQAAEPLAVDLLDRFAAVDAGKRRVHLDSEGRIAARQRDGIRLEG